MVDEHSPEQVAEAFLKAPKILAALVRVGVPLPSFTLFADASGSLNLGPAKGLSQPQLAFAIEQVKSNRIGMCMPCLKAMKPSLRLPSGLDSEVELPDHSEHDVTIDFCCGLTNGE